MHTKTKIKRFAKRQPLKAFGLIAALYLLILLVAVMVNFLFLPQTTIPAVSISQEANRAIKEAIKPVQLLTDKHEMEIKIRELADRENFQWPDYLVKLANCESKLNPNAVNDNGAFGKDRGLFQINSFYHPNISDEQAFDVEFATKWTMNMINKGYQHRWACNDIVLSRK